MLRLILKPKAQERLIIYARMWEELNKLYSGYMYCFQDSFRLNMCYRLWSVCPQEYSEAISVWADRGSDNEI